MCACRVSVYEQVNKITCLFFLYKSSVLTVHVYITNMIKINRIYVNLADLLLLLWTHYIIKKRLHCLRAAIIGYV